jgi:hypothetical protein
MKKNNLIHALLILGALIIVVSASIYAYFTFLNKKEVTFDASKVFATLDTKNDINDFLEIEQMISKVMDTYGTKAGFQLIDEGEKQGIISNDQCHGLLHYVGHKAYLETPTDYDAIVSVVEGTNCIGGYLHGVEAEIVLASTNVLEEVQNFCTYQIESGVVPGICYHGVGHAAIELYEFDTKKALALCDALEGGPEKDLTNCYRGIFSELGNTVVGSDGHTGLTVDKQDIPGLDPENPFAFCETFEKKHQSACKSQLIKVALGNGGPDTWYKSCMKPGLSYNTQEICVNIVTSMFVRMELSFKNSVTLPEDINLFSEDLQKIGVLGSAEAYAGYFSDGMQKEWEPFCASSFTDKNIQAYCTEVFTDVVVNKNAPWMERSDIR